MKKRGLLTLLQNSFVWQGNIPADISNELMIIQ